MIGLLKNHFGNCVENKLKEIKGRSSKITLEAVAVIWVRGNNLVRVVEVVNNWYCKGQWDLLTEGEKEGRE